MEISTPDFWTDALEGSVSPLYPVQLRHVALGTLAARRALDKTLPPELIPDPALDILLALFTLVRPGDRVASETLCAATTVGRSVAQRYLQALAQYGFVAQDASTDESALTPLGIDRVSAALEAIVHSQVEVNVTVAAETVAH